MLFLGRPLFFLGEALAGASVVTTSGASKTAFFRRGVPGRFAFGVVVVAASDFLGLPRRFGGTAAPSSFNGTVVVVLRSKRLAVGDAMFSSESSPGSAWTVTLMRQGLALPCLGVLSTSDFVGDVNCEMLSSICARRFCFEGELELRPDCDGRSDLGRVALAKELSDALSGSGDDSGL